MKLLLLIGVGSALGGLFRYGLDDFVYTIGGHVFPIGTFLVNVVGSFLVGWIAGIWSSGHDCHPHPLKFHFLVTGFCGGFTTFSSFAWQVFEMIRLGEGQFAGFYAAGSVGGGVLAVWLGLSLAYARTSKANSLDKA